MSGCASPATPARGMFRLRCVVVCLALVLFLVASYGVTAEKEVDSDLIFEDTISKELGKNTNRIDHRHKRDHTVNRHNKLHKDEEDNSHWLTKTVHRIKRGFLDWFGSSDQKEDETHSREVRSSKENQDEHQNHSRQIPPEDEEDYAYDDTTDNTNPHSDGHNKIDALPAHRKSEKIINQDDEDFNTISGDNAIPEGSGKIEHTSGEGQLAYYRFTLTVKEPWIDQYSAPNSAEFKQLAHALVESINKLYETMPGKQSSSVVDIKKRQIDSFTCLVTVDLGSINYFDFDGLKNHLYDHIQNYQRLEQIPVGTEDFTFRKFEVRKPPVETDFCRSDEMRCRTGNIYCVPQSARCNKVEDCSDGSDEIGCEKDLNKNVNHKIDDDDYDDDDYDDGNITENPIFSHHTSTTPGYTHHTSYNHNHSFEHETSNPNYDSTHRESHHHSSSSHNNSDDTENQHNSTNFHHESHHHSSHHSTSSHSETHNNGESTHTHTNPTFHEEQHNSHSFHTTHKNNSYHYSHSSHSGHNNPQEGHNSSHHDHATHHSSHNDIYPEEDDYPSKYDDGSGNLPFDNFPEDDETTTHFNHDSNEHDDHFSTHHSTHDTSHSQTHHHHHSITPSHSEGDSSHSNLIPTDENYDTTTYHYDLHSNKHVTSYSHQSNTHKTNSTDHWDNNVDEPTTPSDVILSTPEISKDRCRADDKVRCSDSSVYICDDQKCDGVPNCPDGSDEEDCEEEENECATGEFGCDLTRCIPKSEVCDGIKQCDDGTDESNCPEPPCTSTQFRCDDGHCIDESLKCNRYSDCSNGEDERDCRMDSHFMLHSACNPSKEFKCGDGYTCIPLYEKCDRTYNCPDHSDEIGCPFICNPGDFVCSPGTCISSLLRCDGTPHCYNKADEQNCNNTLCTKKQFTCANGQCIDIEKQCDGIYDCSDVSDEVNCSEIMSTCSANEFQCAGGECIAGYKRCNGYRDCANGDDEDNCEDNPIEVITCRTDQFRCNGGTCIQQGYRCDGVPDCPDHSDEQDCGITSTEEPCSYATDIRCEDGSCVHESARCNGIFDCVGGIDEEGCFQCAPLQFKCNNNQCINQNKRCDGMPDCSDGSDEKDCACRSHEFRCSNGQCIDSRRRCDNYPDCTDNSDELDCGTTCRSDEFQCSNGVCISDRYRCDGYNDCDGDDSDEQGCQPRCSVEEEFECSDHTCIPLKQKCDGIPNCPDGRDEDDCPPRDCGSHEFRCDSEQCIPKEFHCDRRKHCKDGSDEKNCGCQDNEFTCSSGECISYILNCDGRKDCYDGSDERNCVPIVSTTATPRCGNGQWQCHSGECISYSARCDGKYDCNDYSDESSCSHIHHGCRRDEFRCENGPCIPNYLRCDGKKDCRNDSSDELDCPYGPPITSGGLDLKTYPNEQIIKESREVVFQCRDEGPLRSRVRWLRGNNLPLPPGSRDVNGRLEMPDIQVEHSGSYICEAVGYPSHTPGSRITVSLTVEPFEQPITPTRKACELNEATCSNGDCIPKTKVCDGNYDCTDGSDETRCSQHSCEPNEFRCNNKRCVLKTWRCDSDDDCGDGSDEANCSTNPPGSPCRYHEFECRSGNQCIPKSFHCDLETDCQDGSDEIGCTEVVIQTPPPGMITLEIGNVFQITCRAVGVPTPEVMWRLNWGHIPEKCTTTSKDGFGTLTCPNIQVHDQGAYSCEAINIRGSKFAIPDTILTVKPAGKICPPGYFNDEARSVSECISCFCFGATKECDSADLFTYQLHPPFDSYKVLGVKVDQNTGSVEVRDEPIYRGSQPRIQPFGRSGVQVQTSPYSQSEPNIIPYFAMPENYHGNQLKSYGGFLKYNIKYSGPNELNTAPDIIITGNGYTLAHISQPKQSDREHSINARFFVGEWVKRTDNAPEKIATREEIMMTLASIDNILIKLQYHSGPQIDTTISNIEMDSAAVRNTGQGQAHYVEECRCPAGYTGLSCEKCDIGYMRQQSGQWLGKCMKEEMHCPLGTYGDPSRGIPCELCPCPLTNPSNQFARTCRLGTDGLPICDCPPGYDGRRCERCSVGYTGNPLIPGDSCRPGICDPVGSRSLQPDSSGQCPCKEYTTGSTCNQCKANKFHLSPYNQFGCIACFCMAITSQCTSSNWYRDTISTHFTHSRNDFKLIESLKKSELKEFIEDGIRLDKNNREIVYDKFSSRDPDAYYWVLPSRYLGDKITAYGGYLNYTLRYVPAPGGLNSVNTHSYVEIVSENDITLMYFGNQPQPNSPQSFSVPLFEQYWQRSDGQKSDREHLLMALADLKAILIKATYTTHTHEAALISVSLDIADERNTGRERALEVEQCHCPQGYRGLSCEDCDFGYTRADNGLYLGNCEPCNCNGHSNECDPVDGTCYNCRDQTTGENCERCLPGYDGDATIGTPNDCRPTSGRPSECVCDKAGSTSQFCYNGQCTCKSNVEGAYCDECKKGSFGLSESNEDGCSKCFCSGLTEECGESNLNREQIPSIIFDSNHGFILTDQFQRERITDGFTTNIAYNEISYSLRPSASRRLYWSLPSTFTGNKITSYGGKLEFMQRYNQRPGAFYTMDMDILLIGNGITLYWSNPNRLVPDRPNNISVTLSTSENWQRYEHHSGPRRASRDDILLALANLDAILIRATPSNDTSNTFISDITLDTAVTQYTGKGKATEVETCKCPTGYRGTSCELCATGYYRDVNNRHSGPLGSCERCPCNSKEQSCALGSDNRIICNCLPGFYGDRCEYTGRKTGLKMELFPKQIKAPPGSTILFSCQYEYSEPLEILIFEDDIPRYDTIDVYSYYGKASKFLRVIVECKPIVIKCAVRNKQMITLGQIKGIVNNPEPPQVPTETPIPTPLPPTIQVSISAPTIQIIEIGSTLRLKCQGRSVLSSPIQLRWMKEGSTLPRDRAIDDRSGLLIISDVRVSDSGTYICHASDGQSTVTESVSLTVGGNEQTPPRVSFEPSYLTVTEGDPIEIKCLATGNPKPSLEWTAGPDVRLNPEYTFYDGVFRIPYARRSDEGQYICTARNSAGTDSHTTLIYVREGYIPPPPTMTPGITPTQHTGRVGEPFTLTCTAPGTVRSIVWSKVGAPIPYSSNQRDGVLTVYSAKLEDSGTYICNVTSLSGLSGTGQARVNIVSSNIPPTVHIEPDRQTVAQGTVAELRCIATGTPTPSVKWTKVGEEFGPNIQETGQYLRIMNTQVRDRGVYVCIVHNEGGLAQASSIVEVEEREPPAIEIYPKTHQTVTIGGSTLLQCLTTSGIPQPKVWWKRNDNRPMSSNIEELSGGVLRFSQITMEEDGQYICHAENIAGQTTSIATIEVQSLPLITITPRSGVINLRENDKLRLECHASGHPQPTVHWTRHTHHHGYSNVDTPTLHDQQMAIFEITAVTRNDQGQYICLAQNSAGASEERIQLIVESSYPTRGDISEDSEDAETGDDSFTSPPSWPPRNPQIIEDEFVVPAGARAEMRCKINYENYPGKVYFTWIRSDNSSLPQESSVHEGTLYINNAQPSAAGEYICLGKSLSQGVLFTHKARLRVAAPPRITLSPPRQVVRPGDNAHISCTASGDQPIEIKWSAMNRQLPRTVQTSGGQLQFYGIQTSDAGRYVCTAKNSAGEADAVAEVVVNEHPQQPSISTEYREQSAFVGSSVQLSCRAQHYTTQRPSIRWTRDRQALPPNAIIRGDILQLVDVQVSDAGRYICEMSNEFGTSKDYINLIVNQRGGRCRRDEFECRSGECIPLYLTCDRRFDCPDASDELDCTRLRRDPQRETIPALNIESSNNEHHIGDTIDIRCRSSDSGAQITWSKLSGRLADNVFISGPNIRINSLKPENAGYYRCEANGYYGVQSKDYEIHLIDTPARDDAPIQTKTAPLGSTVAMDCHTDLPNPVTYQWTKQGGSLPLYLNTDTAKIQLRDVKESDAGTYICTASSRGRTIDVPTVLVVTGIVPFFGQAPNSYVALPTLPDAYLHFNFEVSFKPETPNGIIIYNGQKKAQTNGDFISLVLNDGYPEFRFSCGSGHTTIKGDKRLELGKWHTIKVTRSRRDGKMFVNGQDPYSGISGGRNQGLDLSEPFYVGGVPNYNEINPNAGSREGFVGCISRLVIGRVPNDLMRDPTDKVGITICETCTENPCYNQGVCQEAQTKDGFTCLCPAGFSGPTCNKVGEACYPDVCGTGRCVDKEEGFDCYCPLGKAGRRCERDVTISEPAFSNNAFVAYPTPNPQRRLKMNLKIKPRELKDGVLLYCAESEEGYGHFISLSLKDKYLEFKFDVGSGPTTIRSIKELKQDEWVAVTVSKYLGEVKLVVNGEPPVSGKSPGTQKSLSLHTPLYVGGYDKERIKLNSGVGVQGGFDGCVSAIDISGINLNLITSVMDSANVQDCSDFNSHMNNYNNNIEYGHEEIDNEYSHPRRTHSSITGCSSNPCRNDGHCYPISSTEYTCSCINGYTGSDCEIAPNLCDHLQPCQNGGSCEGNTTKYKCDCPLGHTGLNCEQRADIRNDVSFSGDGYLELSRTILPHDRDDENEVIALQISTNTSDGLIFWHGQGRDIDGAGEDFIALSMEGGYLEFSYDLGSGPVKIRNEDIRVDDGQRHSIILKRKELLGSIEIDHEYIKEAFAPGITSTMNCNGNIYLGGLPNISLMTGGRFNKGFDGCIHGFEVQDSNTMDLGAKSLFGVNVKACSSWDENDDFDDIVN